MLLFSRNVQQTCSFTVVTLACLATLSAGWPVEECPGSEVPDLRFAAKESELSLFFYYVSWCNESRAARKVFQQVAEQYHEAAYFAAADCWHLQCNCSKTHAVAGMGSPNKWPTLMVEYGGRISMQYHGEWTLAAVTRFLDKLFRPAERVCSQSELQALNRKSDAVVLGLFEDANTIGYRKFISAAVKWLETDPEGSFRFATALAPGSFLKLNANESKSIQLPRILLIRHKERKIYNATAKWSTSHILLWLKMELKRVFRFLNGYSTPTTLAAQVMDGSTLAIFAKDAFYDTMEEMLEVDNDSRPVREMANKIHSVRSADYIHFVESIIAKERKLSLGSSCFCITHPLRYWHLQHYYEINTYSRHFFCHISPSCYDALTDYFSTDKLLGLYQHYTYLSHSHRRTPGMKIAITKHLRQTVDDQWLDAFGLHNNGSLSLVVLDNDKYSDFLDGHGISKLSESIAITIIADPVRESIYVMQEPFSHHALIQFVKSYYNNNVIAVHKQSSGFHVAPPSTLNGLLLYELNNQLFKQYIQRVNITTVVLLHSSHCVAFCALMSHTLIQVSALLHNNDIQVVRVNSQTNDLPWEYVMPTIPALLVFPRGRNAESRIYPQHLKINVRNVLGFILAQLEPVDQVKTILDICTRFKGLPERLQKCLQFAKTLATQHIGHHLKIWQIFENERHFVLDRLKEFKEISLDIKRNFRF